MHIIIKSIHTKSPLYPSSKDNVSDLTALDRMTAFIPVIMMLNAI